MSMPDYDVLINNTSYKSFVQKLHVTWPCTTGVPTATMTVNNQGGQFPTVPLFQPIQFIVMGNTIFNGFQNSMSFNADSTQGGSGTTVDFELVAAPDLLYGIEGAIQTVGTNITVNTYGNFGSSNTSNIYVPYQAKWVSSLEALLMDAGDIMTGLIHTIQPAQTNGFRGRLNYDYSGLGIPINGGVDYIASEQPTGSSSLGLYVKGMWQVGPGSAGKHKTGVDLLQDLCTQNLIDSNGDPQFIDWYIDMGDVNPELIAFERGSQPTSGQVTFTLGQDGVQSLKLPVDVTDVKNSIIYIGNSENNYPASGDMWSNYPATANLNAQWSTPTSTLPIGLGTGSGSGTVSTSSIQVPFGQTSPPSQFSNQYLNNSSSVSWLFATTFNLGNVTSPNYFQNLAPVDSIGNPRNLSSFSFWFYRSLDIIGQDYVYIILTDGTNYVYYLWASSDLPTAGTWGQLSVAIPAYNPAGSGHGVWTVASGSTWDFSLNTITQIIWVQELGAANQFNFDYINFSDSYYPYPAYSDFGPTWNGPGSGLEITYDYNSINAYGLRPYVWSDFYVPGNSDQIAATCANMLLSRRGKQSNGTMVVKGANPKVFNPNVVPGYTIQIVSPKNIYVGDGGNIDTEITSWIIEQIDYDYDATQGGSGFTTTFTLNPYYASFNGTTPDTNARNIFTKQRVAPGFRWAQAYRNAQLMGGP